MIALCIATHGKTGRIVAQILDQLKHLIFPNYAIETREDGDHPLNFQDKIPAIHPIVLLLLLLHLIVISLSCLIAAPGVGGGAEYPVTPAAPQGSGISLLSCPPTTTAHFTWEVFSLYDYFCVAFAAKPILLTLSLFLAVQNIAKRWLTALTKSMI